LGIDLFVAVLEVDGVFDGCGVGCVEGCVIVVEAAGADCGMVPVGAGEGTAA